MPIIESLTGECLLLKRLGVEYLSSNGYKFLIDSEAVVSSDYNLAVYIDSIESDSCQIDSRLKEHIVWRVFTLAKKENIVIKFFNDQNIELIPIESKYTISNRDSISLEKEALLNLIESEKYDEFRVLLDEKPYLLDEKFGCNRESLLHYVSKIGNEKFCNLIIEFGIDINISGKNNETPLVRSAEKGNMSVAIYLVKKGAKINGLHNGDNTPLIAASGNGHLEIVEYLLSQGANISKTNNENQTAIQVAQFLFREEIVSVLRG